jgi:fructuronate reductase
VRIAHLGLGNFFRAHQAWYTEHAPDASEWGIAAFTGRRADMAEALQPQEGLYTLVTRGADGDSFEVVSSLSAAHAASDHDAWLGYLRSPELSLVTLTVTEAGYQTGADGGLDQELPDVQADIESLRDNASGPVRTAPGRLVSGLLARAAAGGGPIAIVPCDNLPGNGEVAARVVREMAEAVGPEAVSAVDRLAAFVTTMVDRITPRATDEDVQTVYGETGHRDAVPVVTEPFSEWVVAGEFPAGRPGWDDAGAVFVEDVEPFEQRKLWLLNGSHSLLAYAGSIRGHETVAEAIGDGTCRAWVEEWWDVASRHLELPAEDVSAYRQALLRRFANPRIRHLLAQIAGDGSQKVPVRILPALRAERAEGRVPDGAVRVLAAWICHLRGAGAPVTDTRSAEVVQAASGDLVDGVRGVLELLDPSLADDEAVLARVVELAGTLASPDPQ